MNTEERLEKGNMSVLQAVEDLPEAQWDLPGACGNWSIKETVAHLASYEQLLITILKSVQQKQSPPAEVRQIYNHQHEFNKEEVAKRQYETAQQVINEYNDAQMQVTALVSQIGREQLEQKGSISWFRAELSLADLLNGFSEHAQKHSEQISAFRQQHKQQ